MIVCKRFLDLFSFSVYFCVVCILYTKYYVFSQAHYCKIIYPILYKYIVKGALMYWIYKKMYRSLVIS